MQNPPPELMRLKNLSRWIGSDPSQVQGPGGNTSFKNQEFIWVKGSGSKLIDAETKEIFVSLERLTGLLCPNDQQGRSSIESSLHLLIDAPVVVHTHSTSSLTLGFREDMQELVKRFGKAVVIPYFRPGKSLAEAISNSVDTHIHDFAVLKNHGLLVWGDTVEIVQERILRFENFFKNIVTFPESALTQAKQLLRDGNLDRYLTPDHAVFLDPRTLESIENVDFEPKWILEMYEQLSKVLASSLSSSNLSWLTEEEVLALQNWDVEKLRKESNNG